MQYTINKGIGCSVEFKGLKAQYLFIFAGGLLAVFILFGVVSASLLVWGTFHLNARYGEYGLMKLAAARRHPRYLIHRKSVNHLFVKPQNNRPCAM